MKALSFYCALVAVLLTSAVSSALAADVLWSSAAGSAWLTGSNWTGGAVPANTDNAQFGGNPTGTAGVGINFNGATNAGTQTLGNKVEDIGAVEITSARTGVNNMLIGNSSTTVGAVGKFRLLGATVNGVSNVILRNNSDKLLTIQGNQGTGNQGMSTLLGNATDNIINIDGTGGITISTVISEDTLNPGTRQLTVGGSGTGVLTLGGANTFTGALTINSGATVSISTTSGSNLGANGNTVILNGGTLRTNNGSALTSNHTLQVNAAGGTINGAGAGTVFWDGSVSAGTANTVLTKSGGNILSFRGTNNFLGKYIVTGGELNGNNSDAGFGPAPGAPVADYFTLDTGGALRSSGNYTLNANRGITLAAGGGKLVTNALNSTLGVDGKITGTGKLTAAISGTAVGGETVVLNNSANDYTGGTAVDSGTLTVTNASGSGTGTGNITLGSGTTASTLNVGNGGTGGAVSGNISFQNTAGTSTVNFNRSTDSTYAGSISNIGGVVNKQGAGKLTFTKDHTYTGNTTITTGTLQLGDGVATAGSVAGNIVNNAALILNRPDNVTYSGNISGTGNVTQMGAGVTTLSGTNTYGTVGQTSTTVSAGTLKLGAASSVVGNASVTGGTLLVNGSIAGTASVTGGTLGGGGSIGGTVTINGATATLSPGNSPGTLNIGGTLNLTSGTYKYEIDSSTPTADLVNVAGALNITAAAVSLAASDVPAQFLAYGTKFTLISYAGAWNNGTFIGLPNYDTSLVVGANRYQIIYNDATAGSANGAGVLYPTGVTITAVPEASAFLTVGLGCIFAVAAVWMSKRLGVNPLNVG